MSSFQGSVIAVTGAASGIGLSTAKLLAQRGAHLSLADLQGELLEKAAASCRAIAAAAGVDIKVITAVVDVSQRDTVDAWIRRTVAELGRLDSAANIAGIYRTNEHNCVADEDDGSWDQIIAINLTGTMYCMRAEMASMRAQGAAGGNQTTGTRTKASIVNASSILGLQGAMGLAAYSASKHGVIGLTRSASKEGGSLGIRVNCIAPGFIDTPMLQSFMTTCGGEDNINLVNTPTSVSIGRQGKAEEVAELIVFLLGPESSFITGQCISIDGGWNS